MALPLFTVRSKKTFEDFGAAAGEADDVPVEVMPVLGSVVDCAGCR